MFHAQTHRPLSVLSSPVYHGGPICISFQHDSFSVFEVDDSFRTTSRKPRVDRHRPVNPACASKPTNHQTNSDRTSPQQLAQSCQSILERLPRELINIVLQDLTITSRVHLALTSKYFAQVLACTPGILSFEVVNPSSTMTQLLEEDESFQCWSIDTSKFSPKYSAAKSSPNSSCRGLGSRPEVCVLRDLCRAPAFRLAFPRGRESQKTYSSD